MPALQDYLRRLETIVGDTDHDEKITLNFHWTDYHSAKALIGEIRRMQKEIRLVKKEIGSEQAATRSEFASSKARVGLGAGSLIGGAIFGRRAMGKVNSLTRDDLRRSQLAAMQPYQALKDLIDRLLAQLDQMKAQIELSPEYQSKPRKADPGSLTPPKLPAANARCFFLYLGEEVKGPFSLDQISALIAANAADAATLACPAGSEEWVALYELSEYEQISQD